MTEDFPKIIQKQNIIVHEMNKLVIFVDFMNAYFKEDSPLFVKGCHCIRKFIKLLRFVGNIVIFQ